MRRRFADRGAAVLETAFVLPILLFVMFGIMEIGGALKSYSATAGAVRSGGRVATVAGADPMTDGVVLSRVAQELADEKQVEAVVIWHATGAGDPVPAGCLPTAPFTPNMSSVGITDGGTDMVGACNVYTSPSGPGGAFAMATGTSAQPASYYFGCQGAADPSAATKVDCNWPGKDRRAITSPRSATGTLRPTDYVGVYVRIQHAYYTTMFGSSMTITDHSVSLIEPQGYDTT